MISVVLRVRWRDRELWLMGDALDIQERDLLDLGDPGPGTFHRLLKAGHHGSLSASDPVWIAALSPEVVLFTAGRHNRFNFPSGGTLNRFHEAGTRSLWISGACSGVKVEAAPEGWCPEFGNVSFSPLSRTEALTKSADERK
jgi:competence protein ComEC